MTRFVITVRGGLEPRVRSALADLEVTIEENVALLRADPVDRAGFDGLLQLLQDHGTEILEVRREPPHDAPLDPASSGRG
jgi:hypothetical protein